MNSEQNISKDEEDMDATSRKIKEYKYILGKSMPHYTNLVINQLQKLYPNILMENAATAVFAPGFQL